MTDSAGIDARTLRPLTDFAHVAQSVHNILSTHWSTRVMLREYGSGVATLIDSPMTDRTMLAWFSAAATALLLWEPRFELKYIAVAEASADGRLALDLRGIYYPRGHKGDRTPASAEQSIAFVLVQGADWAQASIR